MRVRSCDHALAFGGLVFLSACAVPAKTDSPSPRIAELERENAVLRDRVETLTWRLQVVLPHDPIPNGVVLHQPKVDASVVAVKSDPALVVLDKGSREGVKIGFVFDVYLGAKYKGQVRITDVQETTSSGMILRQASAIAPGDNATTSLD